MAETKYAFELETRRYDKNGNVVKGTKSISIFADSYEEGLAKAKSQARRETSVGGLDVFESLAGNSKYYDSNKGKYVSVVEDSGKRGVQQSIRGVGSDGSLVKKTGYVYEGDGPMSFSKDLSKEYGGLKEVNRFTPEMIAKDPTNKPQPTQADLYAQLVNAQSLLNTKTSVPSVAGQGMSGATTTNLPTPKYGTGNITNANASVAGLGTLYETLTKQMEDDRKRADALQAQQAKDQKGIMSWLGKQKTGTEIANQTYQDIGVDPADYFAKQKAGIAEIDSLTQEYNSVVASRDAQIAATNDKMGSMNFINNQIAQIERNSAPKLNEISANINSKAATLQALQGNFAEARSFVQQAVDDAVADQKYQLDLFTMFYDMNQDNINRLETRYQDSFKTALALAEKQYDDARSDKMAVGELMLKYYESGININDTLDQALAKAVASGADPVTASEIAARYDNITNNEDTPDTNSVSTYAQAYLDGQIEITSVPEKLRAQVLAEANRIATQALNAPTPVPTQSSRGTLSYLPSAMAETTSNFFSSLFGN